MGHPAGTASITCFRAAGDEGGLEPGFLQILRDSLEHYNDVSVSTDCRPEPRTTFGFWVMSGDMPAVVATFHGPVLTSPNHARVLVWLVAGGRHGRGLRCDLEREDGVGPWRAACSVLWVA
jgi:hypothetical protein